MQTSSSRISFKVYEITLIPMCTKSDEATFKQQIENNLKL